MKARFSSRQLLKDTRGANLVEYIMLVGLVAIFAIVGFQTFGTKVKKTISDQSTTVGNIPTSSGAAP